MSFKTATNNFETAQRIAEESGDSFGEHIAAGLAALADAIKADGNAIKSKLSALENKINSLR